MDKMNLIEQMTRNQAKREAYLEIMEDLRLIGDVTIYLKYMENYDSLKAEYKELEAKLNTAVAA